MSLLMRLFASFNRLRLALMLICCYANTCFCLQSQFSLFSEVVSKGTDRNIWRSGGLPAVLASAASPWRAVLKSVEVS